MSDELNFISVFVLPSKRNRYLDFASKPKHRKKMLDGLFHGANFISSVKFVVPPAKQTSEGICQLLIARGAGSRCYVMSEDAKIDGKTMDLQEAIDYVVGFQAPSIISCIPGQLAYFEGEGLDVRYILEKKG